MAKKEIDKAVQNLITMTGKKVEVEKVWENASLTSAFAAQTINLSMTSNEVIRIEWKPSATGNERFFTDGVVGYSTLCNFIANGNSDKVPEIRTRRTDLTTSGVKFYDAYAKTITNSTTYVQNTTSVIPVAIYKVNSAKGV